MENDPKHRSIKDFFASPLVNIVLFSLFWSIEIFITKLAFLGGAQVIPFTIQSSCLTLTILSVFVLPKRLKELKGIPFSVLLWLLIGNALHMGLGGFLSNAGIQLTTAINAAFLMQFTTVATTTFAWFILKEKMTVAKIASVGTILLGTFLLVTNATLIVPHIGDILILLACVSWGLGGVLVRKVLKHTSVHPDLVSFLKPVAGIPVLLFFVVFSPMYSKPLQSVFHVDIFVIRQGMYVVLNAIFVTFVWIFFNRTLKRASASYAVILSSITPILVTVLALLFLRERIAIVQFVGILLIIASSFLAQYLKFDRH